MTIDLYKIKTFDEWILNKYRKQINKWNGWKLNSNEGNIFRKKLSECMNEYLTQQEMYNVNTW